MKCEVRLRRTRKAVIKVGGADFLTPVQRSSLMRRIRSTRTRPEMDLIEALNKRSISFETNCKNLPGKPDIVIRDKRFAIFVDGEFWHGGQWRQRGLNALVDQFPVAAKRERWVAKIKRNCARDFSHTARLLNDGWTVIRFWAGDVQRDPTEAADYIVALWPTRFLFQQPPVYLRDASANSSQESGLPAKA